MPLKFSKQLIQQLNTSTNIVDLIHGVTPLTSKGKNVTGLCPFHNEKTPSFTVTPEKNMYYCFGCHAHGGPIDFLINYHKMNFVSAIEHLAKLNGVNLHEHNDSNLTLLNEVANFCKQQLLLNKNVLSYVNKRGITEGNLIKYKIGFMPILSPNDLCHKLNCNFNALSLIGVVNPQSKKIRFSNRLIFPITNKVGQTIGFGGRTLQADFQPKYINSPETKYFKKSQTIYGIDQIRNNEHLIVVEGYMDVVQLAEYKIGNCIAVLGTSLTESHLKILTREAKKITFCFDGDNAGEKASLKSAKMCLPFLGPKCEIMVLKLPSGHDPDSYLKEYSKNAFLELLENANDVTSVLIDSSAQNMKLDTAIGKSRFREKMKHLSKEIVDIDFRNDVLQKVKHSIGSTSIVNKKIIINEQRSWVDHLIAMVVSNPAVVLKLNNSLYDKVVNCNMEQRDIKVLILMIERIKNENIVDPEKVLQSCRNSETKKKLVMFLNKGIHLNIDQQFKEFELGIKKIIKLKIKNRKNDLMEISKKRGLSESERNILLGLIEDLNDG